MVFNPVAALLVDVPKSGVESLLKKPPVSIEDMGKRFPVPQDFPREIPILENGGVVIFRDGALQEVIPVYGQEHRLYDYFSPGGEADAVIQQPGFADKRIFAVPDDFYKMPQHELGRIITNLRNKNVDIECVLVEALKAEPRYLPETGGEWKGEKGNSEWAPDDEVVPKKHNPEEKSWGEIKKEYGLDGISFEDGEPDFTKVSEATVEIDDFTDSRNENFTQADEVCAKKWAEEQKDGKEWTAADVKAYRKENNLSWHERSDQKAMDLVPSIVHGNVPHSGGISAAKKEAALNG